jgi:hypothetical protein
MNIAFFTLWLIIIILLGFFIYLTHENVKQIHDAKMEPFVLTSASAQYCYPNSSLENLYPINNTKACTINNQATLTYKFNNPGFLNGIDVLVDIAPTDYLTACSGLCNSYNPLTNGCNDNVTNNPTYFSCLSKLKPTSLCLQPAMPIAYLDGSPYYLKQTSQTGCV